MHTSTERRSAPRFTAREHEHPKGIISHQEEIPGPLEPRVGSGEGWRLVDVFLTGGAPWGFSLKGGLEYHEPLIITKVEEGSQAWDVRLQVGDEVVSVNEYPLTGYRQEAIGLIKGSHKTLALGVRRRTESVNRPHSWHAIKFAQSEALQRQTADTLVSQCRYDASLSSNNLTGSWDQTNLQRVSDRFSSMGSMDSLEPYPHPYPAGHLSQAKPSGSTEYLGGTKHDSAYSSYSTGSGTPDHTLSRSNTTSAENVACKVGAWDSRNWQSPDEKPGAGYGGGRDSPRHSGSTAGGRSNFGPIWHVPDKRQPAAPSPPPPLPVRSDSFAVTKVHERGTVIPYDEEPRPYAEQRPPGQVRGADRVPDGALRGHQVAERGPGARWSYNPTRSDEAFPAHSSGYGSQLSSRSSMEVPAGHAPYHQRQSSDENTYHQRRRATVASVPGLPETGGYSGSTRERPSDSLQQPSGQALAWTSAASNAGTLDPDRHSQYYCVTSGHRPPVRDEDKTGDVGGGGGTGMNQRTKETDKNSKTHKAKRLSHPPSQRRHPNDQDSTVYGRHEDPPIDRLEGKPNGSVRQSQGRNNGHHAESHYVNYPLGKHEEEKGLTSQPRDKPRDVLLSREDLRSQEGMGSLQDTSPPGPQTGKQAAGNDRFATILRNEIQNRKVRLQKSQSTAALTGSGQAEEPEDGTTVSAETSATSSDGSFSSTYKDHLKEVQARVLQATSFRRRGLVPEALPPAPTPAVSLHQESSLPAGPAVPRIAGRRRIPPEKKALSFSEPNKIHEMGMVGDGPEQLEPSCPEPASSLADRRKVFEQTGKPVFQKPLPKQARQGSPEDRGGDGTNTSRGQSEGQQQRLDSFAEYEATWNAQRKPPETRPSGRSHSADNILDSAVEERSRSSCIHERSRSSPSADLHGQNIPGSGRKSAELSCPEQKPAEHMSATPRVSEQKQRVLGERQSPSQPDRFPELPPEGAMRDDPESRGMAAPPDHGFPHHHRDQPEVLPPYRDSQSRGSAPAEAGLAAPRAPPQPKPERRWRSEGVPSHSRPPQRDAGPQEERRASFGADGYLRDLPPPPPPSPSNPSSHPAAELRPPVDGPHPPCPQLRPQRPTDHPPSSALHDAPCRMQGLSENSSRAPKKVPVPVPVRITHEAESDPPPWPDEPRPPAAIYRERTRAEDQDHTHPEAPPPPPASTNGVSPEEERRREALARDIAGRDGSLADILDRSGMRTTMDLMEGIYPQGGAAPEGPRKPPRPRPPPQDPRGSERRREEDNMAATVGLATSSSYYIVSAPKAEMLMKMKDVPGSDSEEELDMDLAHKKHQLIDSLSRKLQVLREVRESLLEDVRSNNALGEEVESSVEQVCRPNELDKFRMFVGDLDKVVSLLLSLSGRLARVENALNSLQGDSDPEERRTLTEKRSLLIRQHEDAKELKENLDRRERVVSGILSSQLSEEGLTDFRHFVKMKAELTIERRKLDDKIKLGEEQLKCLTDSLPPEQRPLF
ncbi:hypothetical protein COCON_G00198260 [Conger conger]|uniref:Protein Shroom2-like n=1 Tax=Conger conger TaxID=82655 RepID=A0A9Q1HRD1_CONCO|nr:hypothetical protein COCON_G00198260 [Conger conger]